MGRKLPGMGLKGTLGYNMNVMTALVELLVKSISDGFYYLQSLLMMVENFDQVFVFVAL